MSNPPPCYECDHDDWILLDGEQYCPDCEETFAEIIRELEIENMVMRKCLRYSRN